MKPLKDLCGLPCGRRDRVLSGGAVPHEWIRERGFPYDRRAGQPAVRLHGYSAAIVINLQRTLRPREYVYLAVRELARLARQRHCSVLAGPVNLEREIDFR